MFPLRCLRQKSVQFLLPSSTESFFKRGTYVFKRKFPPMLHKRNGPPKEFRPLNYVYEVISDDTSIKKENIDVVLTTYVEGLGNAGEVISVRPFAGYEKYLMTGLAAYATPENIAKYSEMAQSSDKCKFSSKYSYKTLKLLAFRVIAVYANDTEPWILTKTYLRTAFRLNGFIVPESAIDMHDKVITGPSKDQHRKEFYVTVTISETELVKVRCRLYLTGINSDPEPEGDWLDFCPPLFEEDREILNSMPTKKELPNYNKLRLKFNR